MKYAAIHINENKPSMNKIVSVFIGWLTGLCVIAKIPIPFISWFTSIHTSDLVLLAVGAVKGVVLAVVNWYCVDKVQWWHKKWKNRKKKTVK
jgi:hypothetical protein